MNFKNKKDLRKLLIFSSWFFGITTAILVFLPIISSIFPQFNFNVSPEFAKASAGAFAAALLARVLHDFANSFLRVSGNPHEGTATVKPRSQKSTSGPTHIDCTYASPGASPPATVGVEYLIVLNNTGSPLAAGVCYTFELNSAGAIITGTC